MKYVYAIVFISLLLFSACTTTQESTGNANLQDTSNPSAGMPALEGNEGTTDPSANLPQETILQVSLTELSSHNKESDCWVSYEGKVYDVTAFLPFHPGGKEKILKYCGTASEFEMGFTKQHGTSKVSVLLEQIYKGDLV